MKIKNWDKWQSYRQDRGAPPWIKIHRNLMSNSDWIGLTDAEKGQLVSMWIVAADKSGHLPDDPAMIRKMCILDGTPDINKFKRLGFIDAKRTPRRRTVDAPETETEKRYNGFVAPSIDEVMAYCQNRNNEIDAEEFVAFYDSKGWMVGKNKMKAWKSAIITWEKGKKKPSTNDKPKGYNRAQSGWCG